MSAERDVFKKIDQLVSDRERVLQEIDNRGRVLIKRAIKEFMEEHPEVDALIWNQDFTREDPMVRFEILSNMSRFGIMIGEQAFSRGDEKLAAKDPQLAKCLEALELKFRLLRNSMELEFGSNKLMCITPEMAREYAIV